MANGTLSVELRGRRGGNGATLVPTDGELLMRFLRHNDHAAFAEVVERHGRLVWLVCHQILRHRHDVEDAFQATFLILAQRAAAIRAADSAAAWLFKVAQRTALAARRKRLRRREESLAAEPPIGEAALPMLCDREMRYALLEELHALPARYQTALLMRYLEGHSRRRIAEQTDCTLGQVQGLLARGRRMLRSRLVRRGVSLSLAAGTIAGASATASAAVTPTLISATVKSCLALKVSGVAAGASTVAVELAKEGLKTMWYASILKTTTAVTAALGVTAIVWALPAGGRGAGENESRSNATSGVALLAQADQRATGNGAKFQAAADENRNAVANAERSKPLETLQNVKDEQESILQKLIERKAQRATELELHKLTPWLLRREVEQLHNTLIELQTAPERPPANRISEIEQRLEDAKNKLAESLAESAKLEAEIEQLNLETILAQRRLEELARISLQRDIESWNDFAQANLPPSKQAAEPGISNVIGPHDVIRIQVANAFADAPIDSAYPVESMGTVALGPTYGRVKVAGLSILEAEDALKKHLSEIIEDPAVQVTMSEKGESARAIQNALSSGQSASRATIGFEPAMISQQQFQQAMVRELEVLHRSLNELRADVSRQKQSDFERADDSSTLVDPNDNAR
jgi:RNA polymerase sigma factor (sigma-70 family)